MEKKIQKTEDEALEVKKSEKANKNQKSLKIKTSIKAGLRPRR